MSLRNLFIFSCQLTHIYLSSFNSHNEWWWSRRYYSKGKGCTESTTRGEVYICNVLYCVVVLNHKSREINLIVVCASHIPLTYIDVSLILHNNIYDRMHACACYNSDRVLFHFWSSLVRMSVNSSRLRISSHSMSQSTHHHQHHALTHSNNCIYSRELLSDCFSV